MKKISEFIKHNPRYQRYKKPLEAAKICDGARLEVGGRFEVVSFREGVLTVTVTTAAAAFSLRLESEKILQDLNQKLGREAVKRVRIKIG